MGIFRINSGKFRRFEGGTLTQYVAGDLVDLDDSEVVRLGHRITPVGQAHAQRKKQAEGDAEPEAPDAPLTSELPDPAQDTPEGEFDGPSAQGDDEAPQYGDGPLVMGGTPVFTASDTPRKTFTELREVVANIGEPSVVADMLEVEGATRKRSTVMTWLEQQLHLMLEEEDDASASDKDRE